MELEDFFSLTVKVLASGTLILFFIWLIKLLVKAIL